MIGAEPNHRVEVGRLLLQGKTRYGYLGMGL